MSDYSKIVSKVVKNEIERLSEGNKDQRDRKDRLLRYIDRVMSDPENTDYIKRDGGHRVLEEKIRTVSQEHIVVGQKILRSKNDYLKLISLLYITVMYG